MSNFPITKEISGYEVSFSRIDNRKRSTLRRRFAAMSTSILSKDTSKMSEEQKEAQHIEDSAEMMNHKFYEEVRDLIFSVATIKGEGNALSAFNSFDNCFERSDELELSIFMEGISVFLGKQIESTGNADTRNLTSL